MKRGIRQNRKCKWCPEQAKHHIGLDGRFNGYYKTCGSALCLGKAYRDKNVNQLKRFTDQRVCQSCYEIYQAVSFSQRWCKKCSPNKKASTILQRYGMSKPQWDSMFLLQDGKCALCPKDGFFMDHDHSTGRVRGLLCPGCNLSVGLLEKRGTEWLNKALKYIK